MQASTLSFTPFSPGAFCSIAAPWRRSKAAKCGEGKNAKVFTLYVLRMNELRPTGEDVKAKKEKLLTCVCMRARWPQVVKGREAGCRRRRKTSGVLIENGELSEKRRGTFSIVGRKGVGRSFDEAEYTGACCAMAEKIVTLRVWKILIEKSTSRQARVWCLGLLKHCGEPGKCREIFCVIE